MPRRERVEVPVVWTMVVGSVLLWGSACDAGREASGSRGRPLTDEELARVEILDGGASPWLPSHFSTTLRNGTALEITAIELEIDGRAFRRSARLDPGEQTTLRLQYLFPEDEGYGETERREVEWRLTGATGVEVR